MRRPMLKLLDKALAAARKKRAAALRAKRLRPVTDDELRQHFARINGELYRAYPKGYKKVNTKHPRGTIKLRGQKITFVWLDEVIQ